MITNEKYILLKESLKAIKKGDINILTLTGSAGVGKTFNTLEYLREKKINYVYVNSYATPLSFYELLYENRHKEIIIFDDLHGANHALVLSMLKSACWISDNERIVSYHSTSKKMEELSLPPSFVFNTKVILIFNKLIPDYKPITNRGITIDFRFKFEEKLKIFEEVKDNAEIDDSVLDYVKINCNDATNNLSIRTMVILSRLKRSGQDVKLFAKEILTVDDDKELLLKLSAKEWSDTTGHHRATYFRHKNRYGLNESQSRTVAGVN